MQTHIKMIHNKINLYQNFVIFIMKNKKIRKNIAKMTKKLQKQKSFILTVLIANKKINHFITPP